MSYVKPNFLLVNKTAETLYFEYAKDMPIFDYHCHLSEKQILENKEFNDIYEIWLSGDHYKWSLMRNYGVDEEYITGKKSPYEKFVTYCKVLATAFGHPLYHWSHLEIEKYFGCDLEINEKNADEIWNRCNAYIKKHHITPQSLIIQSGVKGLFTTNDTFDDLEVFNKLKGLPFKVAPAFRPDKVINIGEDYFLPYINKFGQLSSLDELLDNIENKLVEFIKAGCAASDLALQKVEEIPSKEIAEQIFIKKLNNKPLDNKEIELFRGYMTYALLKIYAKHNIRSEIHIGARRNNNKKMFDILGPDTGFDSISDMNSLENLAKLFDKLNSEDSLPPIILFNLNPKMNVELLTLIDSFQDSSMKGKIQYGAAWWFLDNKEGMIHHLKDYTRLNHIDNFIGMLTDSRSFLSYERHQYFRRILCSFFGELMEKGEMSQDIKLVGQVVKDICYNNASKYFGV